MSWGNKLVLVFIGFATLMGTLVYKAMSTKFDLVSKDYYKDELRYQEKLDGIKNANKVSKLEVKQDPSGDVVLIFPAELKGMEMKGEAWFYCETDASKDVRVPVSLHAGNVLTIKNNALKRERYQVKITWTAGSSQYFAEEYLIVQ